MKKTIKTAYCFKCGKKLERVSLSSDLASIFGPSTYYCKNVKCEHFGVITIGVRYKEKKNDNT